MEMVRGVELSFDRYWLALYRSIYDSLANYPDSYDDVTQHVEQLSKHHAERLKAHARQRGYATWWWPIIITVIVRDEAYREKRYSADWPSAMEQYSIRYEFRPEAVALGNGGRSLSVHDSIGRFHPSTAGTLGGMLHSPNGEFAVTCAHVAGDSAGESIASPGPAAPLNIISRIVQQESLFVGRVTAGTLPPENMQSTCNLRTHGTADALDAALVDMANSDFGSFIPDYSAVDHIAAFEEMHTATPVVLFGWKSGRVEAELAHHNLWHEVLIDGIRRCFGDIFSITPRRPWYLNAPLVKGGDSGSWIVHTMDGVTVWDGMLFAGDGATGYACYAENVMTWVQSIDPLLAL
jgi:hypothetical protein